MIYFMMWESSPFPTKWDWKTASCHKLDLNNHDTVAKYDIKPIRDASFWHVKLHQFNFTWVKKAKIYFMSLCTIYEWGQKSGKMMSSKTSKEWRTAFIQQGFDWIKNLFEIPFGQYLHEKISWILAPFDKFVYK